MIASRRASFTMCESTHYYLHATCWVVRRRWPRRSRGSLGFGPSRSGTLHLCIFISPSTTPQVIEIKIKWILRASRPQNK